MGWFFYLKETERLRNNFISPAAKAAANPYKEERFSPLSSTHAYVILLPGVDLIKYPSSNDNSV